MATVVTGLACSLSLQSAAYLQGLNAAAMATTTAANRMQRAFAETTAATNQATAAIQRQAAVARQANTGFLAMGRSVTSMANAFKGLFAIGLITQGVKALMGWSDAWQEAGNKIAAAAQIAHVRAGSLESINRIATETRAPLEDIADLYAKLIRTSSGLVQSEKEIADITRTVAEAFRAGGASTLEQVNGIRQLAQALGSGLLQGDELRSIRENAPLVAQAIAHELNTTVAGLKKLGAEGKITGEVIIRALQNSQVEIHSAFARTTATFGDASHVLNNAFIEYVGKLNESSQASRDFYSVVLILADNFNALADAVLRVISPMSTLHEAITLYGSIKEAVQQVGFAFKDLIGVDTSGWFDTVVMYGNTVLNTVLHPIESSLRLINKTVEGYQNSGKPPNLGGMGGRGASFDYEILSEGGGFGKGGANPNATADGIKAVSTELKSLDWTPLIEVTENGKLMQEAYKDLPGFVEATQTPFEKYKQTLAEIAILERDGALSAQQAFASRVQSTAGFVNTFLGAAGAMTGALTQLFKDNKAVAIANAIVNTAEAITAALKNPPGPPFSYVYAAAAAVAGAAQIATILSTNPGSSKKPTVTNGSNKSTASSTPAAAGAASTASSGANAFKQNVTIEIIGDVFGPDHFRKIVEGINGVQRDGTALIRIV